MKVSIFGLGYVGAVSCGCFAKDGHEVIGVDVSTHKVNLISEGKSPIVEQDLDQYIEAAVKSSRLTSTTDVEYAVLNSTISIICVGTPSQENGNIDLSYIYKVCTEIGAALKRKEEYHTIVLRSTIVPGTTRACSRIIAEASGKKPVEQFGIASNPEFLREGTAIYDFWNPPYTVIGTISEKSENELRELYRNIISEASPFYTLRPEEAEMVKYTNNNFHATKIVFANEIGNICKELGIDGGRVMDIVAKDTKLNLSSYYMKPGFAFGGSCLPKDVRGLNYQAKLLDLKSPLLNSLLESNENQISRGLQLVYRTGKKKIGVLGFAFKADTDDLRESPMVTIIETLLGKGYEISLYDKNVNLSKLVGKNKEYITVHIPHLSKLLKNSIAEVTDQSDVIILGNKSAEFREAVESAGADKTIIDLVRVDNEKISGKNYVGICW